MTQLQTMSDQELNRKLAELIGYTLSNVQVNDTIISTEIDGEYHLHSFDPCKDPAASLEVQAKAIEVDEPEYFTQLLALKGVLDNYSLFAALNAVALASPRERAEAAYMTLQAYQKKEGLL